MPSSSSERSSSPTPSTRGDLIRSFTTSSQTSADERIAAARAAREQRRREREREGKKGHEVVVEEADEDGAAEPTVPLVRVDEVESLPGDRSGSFSPPVSSSNNPSLAPKLRLHTPSDRSYTPSVPSTPSRTGAPSSSADSPPPSSAAPSEHDDRPAASTAAAPPSSRRSSFGVAEIPPYRAKTASPAPTPPGVPSASTSTPTPPPPARTPSPGVVLSGGLMARLKAQRAAKAAAEAEAKAAEDARQTSSSATETTVEPATTSKEDAATSADVSAASQQAKAAQSSRLPSSSSPPPPSVAESPVSPTVVEPTPPPPVSSSSNQPPSPPAISSPPPVDRLQGGSAKDDAASIVSDATQASRFSPPRGRKTQASKVYGRNGEEFDFDFTELSDVQEQSERSSLSTWRDSLHQHRRNGSASSATANLPSSDSPARRTFPSEPNLNRYSYTGSLGRQQADGSFASSSFDRRYPALPSSFSTKSVSSLPSGHGRSQSAVEAEPDKRIDATSRLLGRSGSSSSIFSGSSSTSARSSNKAQGDPPVPAIPFPDRSASPTRRISPEVARRAAQFETSSDGRRSPTKPVPLFSPLSDRQSFMSENVTIPSSHPKPPPVPPKSTIEVEVEVEVEEEKEDPLVAIERRRTQRRQEIEQFKLKFGDTGGGVEAVRPAQDRDRTWSEIEAIERAQAAEEATPSFGKSSGRTASSELKEQVERRWKKEEVVVGVQLNEARTRSTRSSSTPSSPRPGPLGEGYLRVPPPDVLDIDTALARPEDWVARYSVLTSETLEFRPTDQNHQSRPSVAFHLSDCAYIDDEPDKPLRTSFRPFAAVLKNGEHLYFACDSRVDRVRWVLALQDAVTAARPDPDSRASFAEPSQPSSAVFAQPAPTLNATPSVRTLTPPGSRYSETRETVYNWDEDESAGGKGNLPSYPHPSFAVSDEKRRPFSPTAHSERSRGHPQPKEQSAPLRRERDLFSLYGKPSPRPASLRSSGSDPPLPPLPLKDTSILPPLPSPTSDDHARLGHRRTRSDLSSYNTPHDQPPFRPVPTRASPSHGVPSSIPFSPSSMLPARPSTRSSTSTMSTIPPEEVSELHRDLQKVLDEAEATGTKKLHRDQRYRRLQDRLKTFKQRHGGLAEEKRAGEDELTLAEKVDYLLEMNEMLLRKQEEVAAFHAEEERARRLALEEKELASRMARRINNLVPPPQSIQQAESSRASTPSIRTIKAGRAYDEATFTTRAGIHSASEKLEWERDLAAFRNEAISVGNTPQLSSLASPTTVRHARETASRRLEGLSPPVSLNTMRQEREAASRKLEGYGSEPRHRGQKLLVPPASSLANAIPPYQGFGRLPSRSKDPFAGSGVVEPSQERARPTQDSGPTRQPVPPPAPAPAPMMRPYSEWSGAGQSVGRSSWPGQSETSLEQTLLRILDGFERQNGSLQHSQQHQDRMSQVMGELAKWVAEDRTLRDNQFKDLLGAVNGVVQHVSELPQRLLASLQAGEASGDSFSIVAPTVDSTDGFDAEGTPTLADSDDSATVVEAAGGEKAIKKKPSIGLNPLSSFARLDRQLAANADGSSGGTVGKLKGPRMPGIRLWGAPEPVADRTTRWGGAAATAKDAKDKKETDDALAAAAEGKKPPHGPIVEALKNDEQLGAALQALAAGEGTEVDAGTLSLAVFEILQSMREMQKKQAEEEKRQAEERAANAGLTMKEKAELEAKKAEIVRLEREMQMTTERTAHINELVAQLAERTDKSDAMLAQIAKNVQEGKVTQMDPTLSEEVKKLLGGVRAGVDDHVKDFRGQLTSEVQRMFKEVGKLRDEKKQLQADIAELMQFQAKQGGPVPKAAPPAPTAAPKPAADNPPDPPKPGMPSSGFFGPRPMK